MHVLSKIPDLPERLSDPVVLDWALDRLENHQQAGSPEAPRIASLLFPTERLRELLGSAPPFLRKNLLEQLEPAHLEGLEEELESLFPEAYPALREQILETLAELAPARARTLAESWSREFAGPGLWKPPHLSFLRVLAKLPGEAVGEVAREHAAGLREAATPGTCWPGAFLEMAWAHDLPETRERLAELLRENVGVEEAHEAMTGDLPFFEYVDHVLGQVEDEAMARAAGASIDSSIPPPDLPLVEVWFRPGAPIEELEAVIRAGGKPSELRAAAVRMLQERAGPGLPRLVTMLRELCAAGPPPLSREGCTFLLATALASHLREPGEIPVAELSARELMQAVAPPLHQSPLRDVLTPELATRPRQEVVSALRKHRDSFPDGFAASHRAWLLAALARRQEDPWSELVELAIEGTSVGGADETTDEHQIALQALAAAATPVLLERWDELDWMQRASGAHALLLAGGDTLRDFLLERYASLRDQDNFALGTLVRGVPDPQLLDLLAGDVDSGDPELREAAASLAALLDDSRPALRRARQRAREQLETLHEPIPFDSDSEDTLLEDVGPMPQLFDLRCPECGFVAAYRPRRILVDPAEPTREPLVAEELACQECGERGELLVEECGHPALVAGAEEWRRLLMEPGRWLPETQVEASAFAMPDGRMLGASAALREYREAIARDPDDMTSRTALGNLEAEFGYLRRAETTYREALERDPRALEPALFHAYLLDQKLHRPTEALEVVEQALAAGARPCTTVLAPDRSPLALSRELRQLRQDLRRRLGLLVSPSSAGPARRGPKVGRNDPCPCGSGKKYKKCCLA